MVKKISFETHSDQPAGEPQLDARHAGELRHGCGMRIVPATTEDDIRRAWPALAELRPHLRDPDALIVQVRRQQAVGYRLVLGEVDESVVAAAGYRFQENLAWGKFLYLDDLVTMPAHRGRGFGTLLMVWLLKEATRHGCDEFHLDSGVHRFDAHALYHRHGLRIRSHHFSTRLDGTPG